MNNRGFGGPHDHRNTSDISSNTSSVIS